LLPSAGLTHSRHAPRFSDLLPWRASLPDGGAGGGFAAERVHQHRKAGGKGDDAGNTGGEKREGLLEKATSIDRLGC